MIPRQLLIAIIVLLLGALGLSIYALRMRGRVAQVPSCLWTHGTRNTLGRMG
jgi:hypothetical protein